MESSDQSNTIECKTVYIVDKPKKKDDKARTRTGAKAVIDATIPITFKAAQEKYAKPAYNPETRRSLYDNPTIRRKFADKAFADGPVTDPYTETQLTRRRLDAKAQYGLDWQFHLAETDHIEPLCKLTERARTHVFQTTDTINEIGNSEDNLQVISRNLNQNSKSVGKGGCTQEEWANDPVKMKNVEELIESDKSIAEVQQQIKDVGRKAEKINTRKMRLASAKNALHTFHDAGVKGAVNTGGTVLTMSGIINASQAIKGEKSCKEAAVDTLKAGAAGATTGYVLSGGLTVLYQSLSGSDSKVVQFLIDHNVPGKVITVVLVTGDVLKKWSTGEITTQDCLIQLGDRGINMATMPLYMTIGQTLIPIPIVGSAIGGLVGSTLTSNLYYKCVDAIQDKLSEPKDCVFIPA